MGWYLDGRVSAVVGTHTHVQTADSRILPGGTGYLTDVGMTGPYDGILGMEREAVLKRFLTGLPVSFEVPKTGGTQLSACLLELDRKTGESRKVERILINEDNPLYLTSNRMPFIIKQRFFTFFVQAGICLLKVNIVAVECYIPD